MVAATRPLSKFLGALDTQPSLAVKDLMTLKYYADEFARYGEMGNVTLAEAENIVKLACAQFGLKHIRVKVNPRKKKVSTAHIGIGMLHPLKGAAKAMAVPLIDLAPSMMTWATVLHEIAHHVHYMEFDKKGREIAARLGKSLATQKERAEFSSVFLRREHAHGHQHRVYMQRLVNFFLGNGMITVKPTYLQKQIVAFKAAA